MAVTFYRNQSAADTETYVYSTAPQFFPEVDAYDSPMYEWEKAGNSFFGWSTNRNASDSRGLHQPLEMDSPPVDGESYYAIWTDLVGTTWTLDDSPDLSYSLSVGIAFTSNDIAFESYSSGYDDYTSFGISGVGYANSGGWTIAYDAYNGGWANNAYKTITITANDDAEYCRPFIEFLVHNATQYIPPTPYLTNDVELTSIADAIRTKGGTVAPLVYPTGFVSAIEAIETGGGGSSASLSDVNFYDYDGTLVTSYTAAEFAALDALPANPSHNNLTAQGWNWMLTNAKTYVATYGKLNIGQMYTTNDGKTRIYIHLEEGRLSPMLGVCPNGTVVVDWGDGSATTTLTGMNTSTVTWTSAHTYPEAGDYVITLIVSGSMGLSGASNSGDGSYLLRYSSATDYRNYVYRNAIQNVEIGSNDTIINDYAFSNCFGLRSITIPSSVTGIGAYAFYNCCGLRSVTFPSSMTSIGAYAFYNCYGLQSMAIPSSMTSIGGSAFYNCQGLRSITIPLGVTSVDTYVFANCQGLSFATISSGITSIGGSAFYYDYGLSSITIPSSVTSIGNYAFNYCSSLSFIRFKSTTPPTVSGGRAWTGIPTDCVIYVPSGSLSAYTSATNYPSSSTYTYVEE